MKKKGRRPRVQPKPVPRKRIQGLPKWPPNGEQIKALSGFMLNLAVIAFAAFGASVWSDGKLHSNDAATLLLYGGGGVILLTAAILLLYDIDKES